MTKAASQTDRKPYQLLAPLELSFGQGDGGEDLPAKFSGVAYSGGATTHGVVIDLATTKVAKKLPLLDSHMRSEIIGVLASAEIADHKLNVAGELFSDVEGCAAQKIGRMAKRGAPYQLSVGLFGFRELFLPAGQSLGVNGRTVNGPMYVLQGGTVREVSVVTLGADPGTSTQFFDQPEDGEGDTMTLEQLTAQVATLTAQVTTLTADRDAAVAKVAELQAASAEAAKAARTAAVAQLAADTGETIADAQREIYLSMSAAQFDAAAAQMRSMAQRLKDSNPALFKDTATGDPGTGREKQATFSASDIYAKRAKAAQAAERV